MIKFISTARFAWIATARNTIKELQSTFNAPKAIAVELQGMIASGKNVNECNDYATASFMLREQVGF